MLENLTRDEVEARISEGCLLVIYHGKALRLNSWIDKHPGGDKAILHMVGRDASDEIDVYHSDETLKLIPKYAVGTVDEPWINFLPPIQGGHFRTRDDLNISVPAAADTGIKQAHDLNSHLTGKQTQVIDDYTEAQRLADLEKYPSVDTATQLLITEEFRELHKELEAAGWFKCNYWAYAREASRIISLYAASIILFIYHGHSLWLLALSGLSIGLAWHQLTFIAHDSGHLGITHNYWADNLIGCFIADFLGGLSLGWWKRNHNVHHLVTNDPVHDPDIQHLPFFAVSSTLLGSVYSTFYERVLTYDIVAQAMVKIQHYLYYPILCFGRFNLYRLSWEYLLLGLGPRKGKAKWLRYVEITGLGLFFYWYFYLVVWKSLHTASERWVYVLVSHIATMPVHVQITLSHFAQSTSDLGLTESFAQRQVRTTMDVACPAWLDFIHGGLQFQVIHHLFPRMPRHNFRGVQPRVIEFCEKHGLHYTIYGFVTGNGHVISRLADIAQQAAIFNECNNFCAKEIVGQ